MTRLCALLFAVLLAPLFAGAQPVAPQGTSAVDAAAFEANAPGIKLSADVSWVVTTGNSSTGTLGFGTEVVRRWQSQGLSLAASGTRASSSSDLNYAVGTEDDFDVIRPEPEQTAEYYKLQGRYDYRLNGRLFVLAGASWERNRFSGLRSRLVGETGLGLVLVATEVTDFRATAGATYTNNKEVVPNPDLENNFAGARLSWTLRHRLTDTARLSHDLVLDENLKQSDDFRADVGMGLSVAVSSRLALKASYRLLFRNLPALDQLPLRDATGVVVGSVAAPLRKVDQGLSVSLVFSFERNDEDS